MAKAPVVEESEFRHAVKVAGVTGQAKEARRGPALGRIRDRHDAH